MKKLIRHAPVSGGQYQQVINKAEAKATSTQLTGLRARWRVFTALTGVALLIGAILTLSSAEIGVRDSESDGTTAHSAEPALSQPKGSWASPDSGTTNSAKPGLDASKLMLSFE